MKLNSFSIWCASQCICIKQSRRWLLKPLVFHLFVCLCWGLTSQSTIFQSCRDGATASWVINQYFRGVKCLAQGHNTAAVGIEPPTSRSGVWHSTTEPPRSPRVFHNLIWATTWQNLFYAYANNKCVDQPARISLHNQAIWSAPFCSLLR